MAGTTEGWAGMSWHGGGVRRATCAVAGVAAMMLLASCVGPNDADSQATNPSPSEAAESVTGGRRPATRTPAPAPDPPPKVGTCRRIGTKDLRTIVHDSQTVPCRRRHTAITFHVGRLPAQVAKGATSSGDRRVESAADRICESRLRRYVGGDRADRRLSMLRATYFLPSTKQFARGARWVRCDVYAYATPSEIAALPRRLDDAMRKGRLSSNFARCSPVSPSHPRFRHVICKEPHDWRAVATVQLGRPDERFPGRETVQDRARDHCEARVRDYLGTDSAFEFGFEVPQRGAWRSGDRLGLCWARTTQ